MGSGGVRGIGARRTTVVLGAQKWVVRGLVNRGFGGPVWKRTRPVRVVVGGAGTVVHIVFDQVNPVLAFDRTSPVFVFLDIFCNFGMHVCSYFCVAPARGSRGPGVLGDGHAGF